MDKGEIGHKIFSLIGIICGLALLIFVFVNSEKIPDLVDKLTNWVTKKANV